MQNTDIEFTIGLNTSPAERDFAEFQKRLKHNDKINTLNTLRSNANSSYSSLMNAGRWVRSGDAYEVQNYERMLRQQASRIRGLDRTLRQSFTISPREFTLKGGSYYNMPPAVIGSAQTAYNNYAFRRDAFNNMMGRAGQNVLALPAPRLTAEDILNNAVKNTSDVLNEEELKKQQKENKEIISEEKSINRERDAGIIKLFKITAILALIKKALQGLKNLGKFTIEQNLESTARDVKERGFFSIDAYGARHSNVDKERASILRGVQHYGKATPFSMEDFDNAVKSLQELRSKAESGQGISSEQKVISLDRLSRLLGLDWNVSKMLTNPNLDLTNIISEGMEKVEKFLPELDKLDDISKSLFINDVLEVFGSKLADAMQYNSNLNLRTGGTETVIQQVKNVGQDVWGAVDYTLVAKKFTDAFADAMSTSDKFKKALGAFFAPAGEKVADVMQDAELWLQKDLDMIQLGKEGVVLGKELQAGENKSIKDKIEVDLAKQYYKNRKTVFAEEREAFGKKEQHTFEEILHHALFTPEALKSGLVENRAEWFAERAMISKFYALSKNKDGTYQSLGELQKRKGITNKENQFLAMLINELGEGTSFDSIKGWERAANTAAGAKFFKGTGEDSMGDFALWMNFEDYIKEMVGEDWWNNIKYQMLTSPGSFIGSSGMPFTSAHITNDINKDGKIDGNITITLVKSDGSTETHEAPLSVHQDATKQVISYTTNFNGGK